MDLNFSTPEFLAALKRRESEAITQLVKKYNRHLFNTAMGQNFSEDQAEELVQSTWSAFFEGLERFEGKSHVRTYLFGILYNKMKENWRHNKKFVEETEEHTIDMIIDNQFSKDTGIWNDTHAPLDPEKLAWISETGKGIEYCMDKLGANYRMAFYLKEVEGQDSHEICDSLKITRSNLGVLLYRAKNLLRKCLEKRSITGASYEQ